MTKRIPPKLGADAALPLPPARWQLGAFELDETRRELRRGDAVIVIEPKPLNLLMLMVRHPGELLTKDELVDRLWGGRAVSDTVIARCVAKLRAALDEHEDWVRTIHGYGYRYDGWVEPLTAPPDANLPAQLTPGGHPPGREDWRLVRRLGQSGETWLAEHADGGQRVYKLALDAARLSALKREATVHRLLLAQPSGDSAGELVPLLDWNFHAAPYFLEFAYCEHGNLADWLKRQTLPLPRPRRLALMAQLAEKLAAIHALGVLHKDLKPDNIVVLAEPAGELPRLALADFGSGGIADKEQLRLLGFSRMGLTVTALDSAGGSGTPLYFAPEVIAGRAFTRQADIYALGVMLYQVLVDDLRRPLAPGWERDIDDPLLREDIAAACDQSPSHRIADAHELAIRLGTLEARRAERQRLETQVREAAALKVSLARARQRRVWQGAVMVVLLLGIAVSTALHLESRRAQRAAERASATANAVSRFLDDSVLGAADPYRVDGGRNVTIASVLDKAVRDFDRLKNEPELQLRLGRTLATAYHNLGLEPQAREVGLAALAAAGKAGLDGNSADLNALRDQLAWIQLNLSHLDEAGVLFKAELDQPDSAATAYKARYGLARLSFETGYFARSAQEYRPLIDGPQPEGVDDWYVADVRWDLAESLFELHDWEGAKVLLAAVRRHYESQLNHDNARLLWLNLSDAYRLQMLEHWDAAEALLKRTRDEASASLGEGHPITMSSLHFLGIIRNKQHRAAEALPLHRKVFAWRRTHYGDSHYLTRMSMSRLAESETLLGNTAAAEPLYRRAWQGSIEHLGKSHPHTIDIERMLAECLIAAGRAREAESLLREVLSLGPERLPARNNRLVWARYGLALALRAQGERHESQALLEQARTEFVANYDARYSMVAGIDALLGKPVESRRLGAGESQGAKLSQ